ncbi:hypothetical protein AGOR_G00073950 [Albula goreensis]|uniref:Uncharacterized protein n=1 Tax=Albula goreensis TaxID=1534307 RepID=A0A8T3DM92_9TELE|nr:hypothetical protein AGOR_G00073950 [Albula goreensis]
MKTAVILIILVSAVLPVLSESALAKFGALCSGNPSNRKRGCDGRGYGCGNYGASRGGGARKHLGLDIVCADGATVYAPFDVTLGGRAVPYKKNNAINDGINLKGEGLCFKLFYVKPTSTKGQSRRVRKSGHCCPCRRCIQELPLMSMSRCVTNLILPNTSEFCRTSG